MKHAIVVALLFFSVFATAQTNIVPGNITASSTDCSVGAACVVMPLGLNSSTGAVVVSGTFVATLQFEGTVDGVTWASVNATPLPSGTAVTSATAAGSWQINVAGLNAVRVRCSAYTSGTAAITLRYSSASASVVGAGGSTTPGGLNTQVQFNDSGAFGGDAGFTYVKATGILTLGTNADAGLTLGANSTLSLSAAHGARLIVNSDLFKVSENGGAYVNVAKENSTSLNNMLPAQSTHGGQFLTTDGSSTVSWASAPSGTLLDWQGANGPTTGNTTDQTIYTTSVTSIPAGKCIRATWYWTFSTATAVSKSVKIKFGGTTNTQTTSVATTTMNRAVAVVCNNPGVQNAQIFNTEPSFIGIAVIGGQMSTPAETTSGAVTLSAIFNAAATEQITGKGWLVEKVQ